MDTLNDIVREYTNQLKRGQIQKAYKGIMDFMSALKSYFEFKLPDYNSGALYFGYMDMTYFAFTPPALKNKKLKIAIVYLHEESRFELWLAGNNRQIQADYIEMLEHKDIGAFTISKVQPGVDSIITTTAVTLPDFNNAEELKKKIEVKYIEFEKDLLSILA